MKQSLMFDLSENDEPKKYTSAIGAPIYEPKNQKPHILTLCDNSKTKQLIRDIDESSLPDDEKTFLRMAATRHSAFHYERIADYYAHSSPEMQRFMEKSALVIIDFESAIEGGFVRLCDEIEKQFREEYVNE
jgi:hypothetical protein